MTTTVEAEKQTYVMPEGVRGVLRAMTRADVEALPIEARGLWLIGAAVCGEFSDSSALQAEEGDAFAVLAAMRDLGLIGAWKLQAPGYLSGPARSVRGVALEDRKAQYHFCIATNYLEGQGETAPLAIYRAVLMQLHRIAVMGPARAQTSIHITRDEMARHDAGVEGKRV